MDLYRIIRELAHERERVQKIIESLEAMGGANLDPKRPPLKRRGRKSMDALARKEVSARMLRYWANRRAKSEKEKDKDKKDG